MKSETLRRLEELRESYQVEMDNAGDQDDYNYFHGIFDGLTAAIVILREEEANEVD